jgi:preprotein translocase subunit SecG
MGAFIFVAVLIIITCILIVLVVLVQNSKGGGLASTFASSNQFMGVRKTADFLEKTTWSLAIILLVLSLFSIFVIPRNLKNQAQGDTELREQIDNTPDEKPLQDFTPPPGQSESGSQEQSSGQTEQPQK